MRQCTLFVALFLAATISGGLVTANAQSNQSCAQPEVLTAVAPEFIPFQVKTVAVASVIVEAKINNSGEVTSAKTIEHTVFVDHAIEDAAKLWKFTADANCEQERVARLEFVFRILPKETPKSQLTTIFTAPYKVEVRHEVFEVINRDPSPEPIRRQSKKRKPGY
ncbi:MAG TPA: hypothetical protein VFY40_15985 [Blastocatellia bacterium]|nr:hypothetical protein [Blastocatellia bacterium]